MKKTIAQKLLLPVTLSLGLVGLLLRFWLYESGVKKTGLLDSGHPASTLSFVLLFLTLGYLIVISFQYPKNGSGSVPRSDIAALGCWIASFGLLLTNAFDLARSNDIITTVSSILGMLTGFGMIYMGIQRKNGQQCSMILFTLVIFYFMTHLVGQYRFWSAEPQLQHYLFPLLSSVFLMLFAYHRAALDVTGQSFRRYIIFNQAALFFCCMSLNTDNWLFHISMAVWVATDLHIPQKKKPKQLHIPGKVRFCLRKLTDAGFDAYMVGGCVRDSLLNKTPQDYDLCTNALPEEICQVFRDFQLVKSGEKHGTIGVVIEKEVYEITTFRTEGDYTDSRHPGWVKFVPNIEEDLSRRDFTVNAMAYEPKGGLVDPFEDGRI